MEFLGILGWYLGSIGSYIFQMLPCMLVGLAGYLCLRPVRQRRLRGLGLHSGRVREAGLAAFVVFGAGLAALTLFPADLWNYIMEYLLLPEVRAEGCRIPSFYPSAEELALRIAGMADILAPFQEIRRAIRTRLPWLMFMLWGNIGMFLPVGFCTALLWRNNRWWKSVSIGCCCSVFVEFVQFFIGRSTDIDDVILNTVGTLAGYWLFLLLNTAAPRVVGKFRCRKTEEIENGLS